jgi:DNA-binding NtrC family response regulator
VKARHAVPLVDDEAYVRDSLVELLESEGYRGLVASSTQEAFQTLAREAVSAIVTDLKMPGGSGLVLLEEARRQGIEAPLIVLTGVGTVEEAVQAMKAGAFDFIQKPVDPEQFVILVRRAIEHQGLVKEVRYLRSAVEDLRGPHPMVGDSPALAAVRDLIAQVAPTGATVLVTGESGTGKELVAAAIHSQSDRRQRNLVRVNCAAISENLFESEFFGHRRGSFTSAVADRTGRFAEADGGTLILDEIGTLRPEMQAKLLRVLETGEYQVVGESRTRIADARVIAITNEDLAARVRDGAFRRDLYFRLNVFPITVPPLRKRREDIAPIASYFLARAGAARKEGGQATGGHLTEAACEVLRAFDWPGNVRELRNVIERASIIARGGPVDAPLIQTILEAAVTLGDQPGEDASDLHIRRRMDGLERKLIAEALARAGGKKREAAALLGIDPKNLGYYLRKHGLGGGAPEGGEGEEP